MIKFPVSFKHVLRKRQRVLYISKLKYYLNAPYTKLPNFILINILFFRMSSKLLTSENMKAFGYTIFVLAVIGAVINIW